MVAVVGHCGTAVSYVVALVLPLCCPLGVCSALNQMMIFFLAAKVELVCPMGQRTLSFSAAVIGSQVYVAA